MIIRYQPNPLCTMIDLDAHDVEVLRLKLTVEDLEQRIYAAHFDLEDSDIKNAVARLDIKSLEDEVFRLRIDKQMAYALSALSDKHEGDCVCEPCFCSKCHAEGLLGIDTIEGLSKHAANKIRGAFSGGRSLEEAIHYLEHYDPKPNRSWAGIPQEEFNKYIPRWTEEATEAARWLRDYRERRIAALRLLPALPAGLRGSLTIYREAGRVWP